MCFIVSIMTLWTFRDATASGLLPQIKTAGGFGHMEQSGRAGEVVTISLCQGSTLGTLLDHFLPYFFEKGLLTEAGAHCCGNTS